MLLRTVGLTPERFVPDAMSITMYRLFHISWPGTGQTS